MSDNADSKPFATSGSGKSPEEVAFELVSKLKGQGVWGERNMSAILDMYAECLDAAKGLRRYPGQEQIRAGQPVQPVQAAPPQPQPPTPQAVAPAQAAAPQSVQRPQPGGALPYASPYEERPAALHQQYKPG